MVQKPMLKPTSTFANDAQRGDAWEPPPTPRPSMNGSLSPARPASEPDAIQQSYVFQPVDSATFSSSDYRLVWLVERLLVTGQPAIVGGPKKALKTSLMLDLAISLGSGTPFLGVFDVHSKVRCAVLSGESGAATLQETARRVCEAKGVQLAGVDCLWGFTLPQLARPGDLVELGNGLRDRGVKVVIIDPLYLCLLAGKAAEGLSATNLFDMGPLLLRVSETCLNVGCTPILIHHARKSAAATSPLDLGDLAFAGTQEFARQWVLISRREEYAGGTGQHRLWLTAGGSVGHGGCWAVDVEEGQLADDFSGRKWKVSVVPATEAISAERQAERDEMRARRSKEDDGAVLTALGKLTDRALGQPRNQVETDQRPAFAKNKIREESGLSADRTKRAVTRLLDAKIIEAATVEVAFGTGKKTSRPAEGYRRVAKST